MGSANLRDLLYLTCAMYKQGFTAAATGAGFHGAGGAYNGYLFSRGAELMSYASHLPSRCGIEPVLDMAVECIVAVLLEASRHAGTPTFGRTLPLPPRVILTYTLALVELQRALGDEKRSGSREILCATQLLALFEVRLINEVPLRPCSAKQTSACEVKIRMLYTNMSPA